jgi:hypothetical protein
VLLARNLGRLDRRASRRRWLSIALVGVLITVALSAWATRIWPSPST